MKIRKSRRNEYKIISICGFLIIAFCLLIEDMMKKFPEFFSNTSIKITVGVLCFGVLLIAISILKDEYGGLPLENFHRDIQT